MSETLDEAWIRADVFCQKYQQDPGTVRKRVHDGVWERGVLYSCPDGDTAYVHEARAVAWLRERNKLPAELM
jgi:hypothetical protein